VLYNPGVRRLLRILKDFPLHLKVNRRKSTEKIDGIVALAMAVACTGAVIGVIVVARPA
jgi:hypothetical protein